MFNILISASSHFLFDKEHLRSAAETFLKSQKIKSAEVSVAIVGDRKMAVLNEQYHKEKGTTPVLTFSQTEESQLRRATPFKASPEKVLRLGDIVISYPQAVLFASEENKMVDQILAQFVEHGLRNLLGLNW